MVPSSVFVVMFFNFCEASMDLERKQMHEQCFDKEILFLPAHNFGDGSIGSGVRKHELDLALDCGLLGHLGVVDEGAALVAAGWNVTGGHILQTFL